MTIVRNAYVALFAICIFIYGAFIGYGVYSVYHYLFPFSLDGKFQTFGAIELLNSESTPYRDYPIYLGTGVVHMVSVVAPVFGSSILAVQQAATALVGLTFALIVLFLVQVARLRLIWWPVIVLVTLVAIRNVGSPELQELASPGNSLLGLRAFGVVVAGAAVLVAEGGLAGRSGYEIWGRPAIWGGIAGLMVLWSNDYGLGAALGIAIALFVWMQRPIRLSSLAMSLVVFPLAALLAWWIVVSALGASPSEWVSSNFVATAGDQWWLFGPWDEPSRVFSLRDVFGTAFGLQRLAGAPIQGFAILCAAMAAMSYLLATFWRRTRPGPLQAATVVAILAAWAGSMSPTVGGHFGTRYWALFIIMAPFVGWASIQAWIDWSKDGPIGGGGIVALAGRITLRVKAVLLDRSRRLEDGPWGPVFRKARSVVSALIAAGGPNGRSGRSAILIAASFALALLLFAAQAAVLQTSLGPRLAGLIGGPAEPFDFGDWTAGLKPEERPDMEALVPIRAALDRSDVPAVDRVGEAYPSLIGARLGGESSTERLSAILLLGEESRDRYRASMAVDPPVLATSIATDYSEWSEWLLRARWFWFKPLVEGYRPVARTDQHILWLRDETVPPPARTPGTCAVVQRDADTVELLFGAPAAAGDWGVARVAYRSQTTGGGLLDRPLRRLVTVTETQTDAPTPVMSQPAFTYGVPDHSAGEEIVFRRDAGRSRLTLDSAPGGRTALSVTACSIAYQPLPRMTDLPRLADAPWLAARVAAEAGRAR